MAQGPRGTAIREQFDRILASNAFGGSDHLRALLRFVVESRVNGRGDELKEHLIAMEVSTLTPG